MRLLNLSQRRKAHKGDGTNFAFLSVSARKRKLKNIDNVDKVCCLLTVVR